MDNASVTDPLFDFEDEQTKQKKLFGDRKKVTNDLFVEQAMPLLELGVSIEKAAEACGIQQISLIRALKEKKLFDKFVSVDSTEEMEEIILNENTDLRVVGMGGRGKTINPMDTPLGKDPPLVSQHDRFKSEITRLKELVIAIDKGLAPKVKEAKKADRLRKAAVMLIETGGKHKSAVAEEIGVSIVTLRRWLREEGVLVSQKKADQLTIKDAEIAFGKFLQVIEAKQPDGNYLNDEAQLVRKRALAKRMFYLNYPIDVISKFFRIKNAKFTKWMKAEGVFRTLKEAKELRRLDPVHDALEDNLNKTIENAIDDAILKPLGGDETNPEAIIAGNGELDKALDTRQELVSNATMAVAQSTPADKVSAFMAASLIAKARDAMAELPPPTSWREMQILNNMMCGHLGIGGTPGTGNRKNNSPLSIDVNILTNVQVSPDGAVKPLKNLRTPEVVEVVPQPPVE